MDSYYKLEVDILYWICQLNDASIYIYLYMLFSPVITGPRHSVRQIVPYSVSKY